MCCRSRLHFTSIRNKKKARTNLRRDKPSKEANLCAGSGVGQVRKQHEAAGFWRVVHGGNEADYLISGH